MGEAQRRLLWGLQLRGPTEKLLLECKMKPTAVEGQRKGLYRSGHPYRDTP